LIAIIFFALLVVGLIIIAAITIPEQPRGKIVAIIPKITGAFKFQVDFLLIVEKLD
jgi:hypothetical protein